jgi:ABC-2 type transport system permease protein
MNTLNIAFKDLQILFKNRGNILLLFLVPMIFIIIFSGALASLGNTEQKDTRILLAVVNLDRGQSSQGFLAGLDTAGGVRVELYDAAQAKALLDEKKIFQVLTIPADFSTALAENKTTTMHLVNHNDAPKADTQAVQLVITGVLQGMVLEQQILLSLEQMGEMQSSAPIEYQEAFNAKRMQAQARAQFETAQISPLITIVQRLPKQTSEQEGMLSAADTAVPASIIIFVFLTAQSTATSIFQEKKNGSFRRLLAAPVSKASMLAGKLLPNFVISLGQILVLFAFGTLGMKLLGMNAISLGNDPLALAMVCFLMALCSCSLGIVIAALARTEGQITALSTLLLWGMGMVSFIPIFLLQNTIGPFVYAIPHYWAKSALENLLLRGLGLNDIIVQVFALAGFTALFFIIGLWRFDFD